MGTNLDLAVYDIIHEDLKTYIVCKCAKCGEFVRLRRDHYLHGVGCGICSGKIALKGYNDLATCRPELVQYFADPEDATKVVEFSHKRVGVQCPTCGFKKDVVVARLSKNGFRCPICYGGFTMPNRCMASVLKHLGYEFKSEATFEWGRNYRYDFFVPSKNIIIEMNGKQHYESSPIWNPLDEIEETDRIKTRLAIQNGYTFYAIRADRSEPKYIIDQIIKSGLIDSLVDSVNISTLERDCMEDVSVGVAAKCMELWNAGLQDTLKISEITGVERTTVAKYLSTYGKLGLCDFSRYSQILKSQAHAANSRKRPVICKNTGIVYDSIREAAEAIGIGRSSIQNNVRGFSQSAGKDKDGNKLVWEYVIKE